MATGPCSDVLDESLSILTLQRHITPSKKPPATPSDRFRIPKPSPPQKPVRDKIIEEEVIITTAPTSPDRVQSIRSSYETCSPRFGPQQGPTSTPTDQYGHRMPQWETFGSTIGSSDVSSFKAGLPKKFQQRNVMPTESTINTSFFDQSSDISSKFFESRSRSGSKKKKKEGSVLQWFDKVCERELSKRQVVSFESIDANMKGIDHPLVAEASTSLIDVESMCQGQQNTELFEACDKLAKAQAIDVFRGAIKAAEEAAMNAPPEYAEEAAAAGARGYQAELTTVVKEKIPGYRPMEVIGYVGVTRPRKPKKSKFSGV